MVAGPVAWAAGIALAVRRGVPPVDAHRLLLELAAEPGVDLDRGAGAAPELRLVGS